MRVSFHPLLSVSAAVFAMACGSSAVPVASAPKQPTPVVAQKAAEPPADLSPVGAPPGLLVVGRWREPSASIDTLLGWANLPVDWRALLSKNGSGVGAIVAVDSPVELAVVLPPVTDARMPAPRGVVSLGLNSLDAALAFAQEQGEDVQRLAPGVYRVGGDSGIECAAASAVGRNPARLVCGSDFADVEALLPYATRGLPKEELGGSEIHVELRFEPLRPLAAGLRQKALALALNELSKDDARFDRTLAELARGSLDEVTTLIDDADRLSLDIQFDRSGGNAQAELSARFRTDKSWTVQTLVDTNKTAGSAPAMFWRLPADSTGAGFGAGVDPKRFDWARRTWADLLDSALASEKGTPPRVREELVGFVEEALTSRSTRVLAHGLVPSNSSLPPSIEKVRQAVGWHVLGYESEPADKFASPLSRAVRLFNSPQVKKLLGSDAPKFSERSGAAIKPGAKFYDLVFSHEVDSSISGSGKPRPPVRQDLTVTLAVVPVGEGTWLGLSADAKVLTDRLRNLEKVEKTGTLAELPALAKYQNSHLLVGGFTSLRGLALGFMGTLGASRKKSERFLNLAPNRGESPILTRVELKRGATTELVLGAQIPKAAITDLAVGIPSLLGGGMFGESDAD